VTIGIDCDLLDLIRIFNMFASFGNVCVHLRLIFVHNRTVNVEYNQLDPLLRSTEEFKDGDVNDETGYSPFPGNINQLVFHLDSYNKVLERTHGMF